MAVFNPDANHMTMTICAGSNCIRSGNSFTVTRQIYRTVCRRKSPFGQPLIARLFLCDFLRHFRKQKKRAEARFSLLHTEDYY